MESPGRLLLVGTGPSGGPSILKRTREDPEGLADSVLDGHQASTAIAGTEVEPVLSNRFRPEIRWGENRLLSTSALMADMSRWVLGADVRASEARRAPLPVVSSLP